jgi:hypothetical protein
MSNNNAGPQHGRAKGQVIGRWNVVCDRCGLWFKNKDITKEQLTNLLVCLWCVDPLPIDYKFKINPEHPTPPVVSTLTDVVEVVTPPTNDPYTNYYNT